ncbi:MAG: lysylphosphatidylglycerol synthase transmembrane domain-containing protein [Bryobacteraceae bacterium]
MTTGQPTSDKRAFWMALAVTAVVAVAGIWVYRATREGFTWQRFVAYFLGLDLRWLAASAIAALMTYVGRALRWAVLIQPIRPHPSYRNLISATVIGFTALVLLGRPGEFVRPYLIANKEKLSITSQLAAWMLERIYDLLAALLIFGFALSQVDHSTAQVGPGLKWVFQIGGSVTAVLSIVCLGALVTLGTLGDRIRLRLLEALSFLEQHHLEKVERAIIAFLEGTASTRSPAAVFSIVAYTALEWLLIAFCFFSALRAFPDLRHFGWLDVSILMGFVAFGSLVQLPGVGGGTQAVLLLTLRELFGVPNEAALSVAIVVWAMTFLVVVPIGIPLALYEGIGWGKLRSIGRDASP